MIKKTYVFHIAAAVAFLTATPMIAASGWPIFVPNLQFVEDTAQPDRAATQDFLTCGEANEGKPAATRACEMAIEKALKTQTNSDK